MHLRKPMSKWDPTYNEILNTNLLILSDIHRKLLGIDVPSYLDRYKYVSSDTYRQAQIIAFEAVYAETNLSANIKSIKLYGIYKGWTYDRLIIYLIDLIKVELEVLQNEFVPHANSKMDMLIRMYINLAEISEDEFIQKYSFKCPDDTPQYINLRYLDIDKGRHNKCVTALKKYGVRYGYSTHELLCNICKLLIYELDILRGEYYRHTQTRVQRKKERRYRYYE